MKLVEQNKFPNDLWLAVLHYTDADRTRACLNSIQKLEPKQLNVLIADNCSPDNSGVLLQSEFPDYKYLRTPENLGFAGGSNAAVNWCIEQGAKWVWLLNNDTELESGSLQKLINALRCEQRVGVAGARIFGANGDEHEGSGTGSINFLKAKTFEKGFVDETKDSIACQWISGCNMLLNTEAFKELNGFDESFFLYFEDVDLCWRMNKANWACLFVPRARIKHIGGASTEGARAIWRSYYYTRNRLLFFLKHEKGLLRLPIILAISTHLLRHLLVLPFRGNAGRRQLRAELLGLSDYCRKRLGKANCLDF